MAYRLAHPFVDVGAGISSPSGAKLQFFDTGTSNAKTVYSDFALTTPIGIEAIADANGLFPDIFIDVTCDVTLRRADDTLAWGPETVYAPGDSVTALDAEDIAVADAGGYFDPGDLEDVTQQIGLEWLKFDRNHSNITGIYTFAAPGSINMTNRPLLSPQLSDVSWAFVGTSSSSGVLSLDYSSSNTFALTLTENISTFNITNPPATGQTGQLIVEITQDSGGGAYTVALPSGSLTPGGSGFTMSTANGAIDRLQLVTRDGGTTWFVDYSQAYA